jgi:hypothetical protein
MCVKTRFQPSHGQSPTIFSPSIHADHLTPVSLIGLYEQEILPVIPAGYRRRVVHFIPIQTGGKEPNHQGVLFHRSLKAKTEGEIREILSSDFSCLC